MDWVLPHLLVCRVRQIKGFSALFPVGKKCGVPSLRVSASVSSWTRDAYGDLGSADEPATQHDEDDELLLGRPYYWHRSSRRSVWHLPPGVSSRGRGGGEEDQVDSLLRSSSTPAVAYAGWFGWFFSRFVPCCVYRPEMPRIMAGTHQKDSCSRCTGKLDYLGDDLTMFPYHRNAWTSVLHAMR